MKPAKLAVLTDLDGTLLTPEKTLSPEDAAAIAQFRAEGGLFSFATGRGIQASARYLRMLKPDFRYVMYNGAMIADPATGDFVCPAYLPPETHALLQQLTADFPEIGAEVLSPEGVFVIQLNETEVNHLTVTNVPIVERPLSEIDITDCLKALFAGTDEQISALRDAVQRMEIPFVRFTRSHPSFLEILPHGVDKGTALMRIRETLPPDTCICAAGDFENDAAMLKAADFCGCPADAQPLVRQTVREAGGFVSEKTSANGFIAELLTQFSAFSRR